MKYQNDKLKDIPKFNSIKEEKFFFEKNDSTEFINWDDAKTVKFPNLKKSTKRISSIINL
ncbi:MAG: CopG family antitoxin [Campylobacterota bacterium]|nr:CopG family antitoxin [Campylobacterota bacterium]